MIGSSVRVVGVAVRYERASGVSSLRLLQPRQPKGNDEIHERTHFPLGRPSTLRDLFCAGYDGARGGIVG